MPRRPRHRASAFAVMEMCLIPSEKRFTNAIVVVSHPTYVAIAPFVATFATTLFAPSVVTAVKAVSRSCHTAILVAAACALCAEEMSLMRGRTAPIALACRETTTIERDRAEV